MSKEKPQALERREFPREIQTTDQGRQTLEQAKRQQIELRQYCFEILQPGTDFGIIPGTERKIKDKDGKETIKAKKVLLKPGAERLCQFLKLYPRFQPMTKIEIFDPAKPLFHYQYECQLFHMQSGHIVGTGIGSCNSMESKYRWRAAKQKCPSCGAECLKISKFPDKKTNDKGFYCYAKIGGCGAQFHSTDERITSQETGKVPNPDPFDQINTIDKMAQKRSLLAAVLITAGVSEYFTQDMEDFGDVDTSTGEVKDGQVDKADQGKGGAPSEPGTPAHPVSGPPEDDIPTDWPEEEIQDRAGMEKAAKEAKSKPKKQGKYTKFQAENIKSGCRRTAQQLGVLDKKLGKDGAFKSMMQNSDVLFHHIDLAETDEQIAKLEKATAFGEKMIQKISIKKGDG